MAQKPSIPKGTRDFGPVEMAKRKKSSITIAIGIIFLTLSERFMHAMASSKLRHLPWKRCKP